MNTHGTVEEALRELRSGNLIIVVDDEDREAEGDLIGLSETATTETVNFMTKYGRGLICTPIKEERAQALELAPMVKENSDTYQTQFTVSVDHRTNSTGISAKDRADTICALANSTSKVSDFRRPGHIFPLIAKNGGVLERRGHTEAAIDLAALTGANPSAYICEILNEDGSMARYPQLKKLAATWNLVLLTVEDIVQYRRENEESKIGIGRG